MATVEKYKTQSGTTLYMVRYRQPNNRQTMKRGFRTRRDANDFASMVEAAKLTGQFVAVRPGRVAVGELAQPWLTRKAAACAPSHTRMLESAWRVHVAPTWSATPVADVNTLAVESWVADMTARGSGRTTVTRAVGVLSGILNDAVKSKRLAVNPARGIENVPPKAGKRRVYLTASDVHRLADESGPRHRALVLLLAFCGLRWGEAVALRVQDVEFLRRRILVHENAVQIGVTHHVGPTKGRETRSVPTPQFVLDELSAQCRGKGPGDLVFPGEDKEYLPRPKTGRGWFEGAVKRAKVQRVTPHDLRHTCASLAVSAGANVLALARMLGHKDPSVTLRIYADLFDTDLDALAASLNTYSPAEKNSRNVLNMCSPGDPQC
jgi:integrase